MAFQRKRKAKIIGVFAFSSILTIWMTQSVTEVPAERALSWGLSFGIMLLWAGAWLFRVIPVDSAPQSVLRARLLGFCGLGLMASMLVGGPEAYEAGVYEDGVRSYGSYEFQTLGQVLLCLYAYLILNESLRSSFGWPARPGKSNSQGPIGTSRLGRNLTTLRTLTAVSVLLAVAAAMPPFAFSDELILIPSIYAYAPQVFFLGACVFGFVYRRRLRKRRCITPQQVSAQNWAALGLCTAVLCAVASLVLRSDFISYFLPGAGADSIAPWSLTLSATSMVLPALSYQLAISPSILRYGGKVARTLVASSCTFILLGLLLQLIGNTALEALHRMGNVPAAAGLLLVGSAIGFACYRGVSWVSLRAGAPRLHKLLIAARSTAHARENSVHLDDIAQACLTPIRAATDNVEADPILYVIDPDRELRIDLAGLTRTRARSMPEALAKELRATLGQAIITAEKEEENGRYLEASTLLQVLRRHDTSVALPLVVEQELIGALLVPNPSSEPYHGQGRPHDEHRMVFSSEEMTALENLASKLAPHLALVLKGLRSVERSGILKQRGDDLEEEVRAARAELALLREEANSMRASGHTLASHRSWIAHSDAMREFEYQGKRVAPINIPLLIASEPGNDAEHAAWYLHAHSTQTEGPWILADCALVEASAIEHALFGAVPSSQPPIREASEGGDRHDDKLQYGGWLRLAKGGTLVLLNLPALPEKQQHRLAVALSSKKVLFEDNGTSYPLEARIIATCLSPQGALDGAARLHPNLRAWLKSGTVRLPPLRRRQADIPSLALSEISRACRMLGRETLGLTPETIAILRSYPFPGNLQEFRTLLWTAVAKASGPQLKPGDLPQWLQRPNADTRNESGLRKVVGG